jgi:hypothetical protein
VAQKAGFPSVEAAKAAEDARTKADSGSAVKAAADAVVALFCLAAVSSRLIRVLVLAPWCA